MITNIIIDHANPSFSPPKCALFQFVTKLRENYKFNYNILIVGPEDIDQRIPLPYSDQKPPFPAMI